MFYYISVSLRLRIGLKIPTLSGLFILKISTQELSKLSLKEVPLLFRNFSKVYRFIPTRRTLVGYVQ